MNGFFDGQFRRTPNVSMGGASKKLTKEELLAKAQREREQRQVRCQHFDVFLIIEIFSPISFSLDNQTTEC